MIERGLMSNSMRESRAWYVRTMSAVLSVEAPSTTRIWRSFSVCAITDSRHVPMKASSLRAGITTVVTSFIP